MVEDTIDDMVKNFEQQLSQQGLTLENFLGMSQTTQESLREQYRESAIRRIERSLVLGELYKAEELAVNDTHISSEVKNRANQLSRGDERMRDLFEQYLGGAQARRDIALDLMTRQTYARLAAIARGEEPPIGPAPEPEPEPAVEEAPAEEAPVAIAEAEETAGDAEAAAEHEQAAEEDKQEAEAGE
jgi:hypothetical protein